MKRILLFSWILLIAFSSIAQPVKKHGALKVEGVQLKDAKGNDVVLRGIGGPAFIQQELLNGCIKIGE